MHIRNKPGHWLNSLSLRVIAGMTAMTTAAVLLSGAVAGYFLTRDFDARITAQNQQQADYLMSMLDSSVLSGSISLLSTIRIKNQAGISRLSAGGEFSLPGAQPLKTALTERLLPYGDLFVSLVIYYREDGILLSTREGLGFVQDTLAHHSDDTDWIPLYEEARKDPAKLHGICVLPQRRHGPSGANVISMVSTLSDSNDSIWLCLNLSCPFLDELVGASLAQTETQAHFSIRDERSGAVVYRYGEVSAGQDAPLRATSASQFFRWTGLLETGAQALSGRNTLQNFLYAVLGCTLVLLAAGIFLSIKLTYKTGRGIVQTDSLLSEGTEPEKPRRVYSIDELVERIQTETVHQKQYLMQSRSLIKENFLFSLFSNENIREEDRRRVLDFLKISFPFRCFTCCVMEYRPFSAELAEESVNFALKEFVSSCQRPSISLEYCRVAPRSFVLVLNYDDPDFGVESLLGELNDDLEGQFDVLLHFGVGGSGDSLGEISVYSAQALSSLRYSVLYPHRLTFLYRETLVWDQNRWNREGFTEFCSRLSQGRKEECCQSLRAFRQAILDRRLAYTAYQEIVAAAVREIETFAAQNMIDLRDLFVNSLSDRLESLHDIDQVFGELEACLGKVLDYTRDNNVNRSTVYIRKTILYIRENYARDLSVQEIADAMGLSRYYLSRLFKEATGSTLLEYLMEVRMKKSKELLSGGEGLTVAEVAARVGFNSPSYFDKKFKQTFGCSPAGFQLEQREKR